MMIEDYSIRKSSIHAFFSRAVREQRVILTTSKALRERASCPPSYYIDPKDLTGGLKSLIREFSLEISRDKFLTVCGRCGDDIEQVTRTDPRLQARWLPTDRDVFACVNCAQVKLWT